MKILILGGAGMVGRKLAERLAADGQLGGKEISELTLYDVVAAQKPAGALFPVNIVTGDLPAPGETDKLVAGKPDVIFHLAAIVSGEAEQEFDKGYRINLHGTMNLLESVRQAGHKPRVVFTSSIAVFGAPFPDKIPDNFFTTPLTSYGTQKAIGELLLADWDSKMAKIDKQLESIADDQLVGTGATTPAQKQEVERLRAETSTFGVFTRLVLSVALGVGIVFWPYVSRCGIGLTAYLGAVAVVVGSGVWSAIWTFRHRAGRAHALSLLLILWGLLLAAQEILPRMGYAVPTPQHPATWSCL